MAGFSERRRRGLGRYPGWVPPVLFLLFWMPQASAASPIRVVTLSPALAEIMFDVGAQANLVGTVRYSRHPTAARKVPRVGDAFSLDVSRILLLHPTLILAWKGGTPPATIAVLRRLHLRVVSLDATHLRGIARELITVGRLTGHAEQAERVARVYLSALARIRRVRHNSVPLSVFYEISRAPLYTVGRSQIISRAIRICGGYNLFDDIRGLAFPVALSAVLVRNPDVIIVGRARAVRFWDRFRELRAVQTGSVDVIRPGLLATATPRMLRGIHELCRDLARSRAAEP